MNSVHPDEVLKAILERGCRKDKEAKLRRLHEICLTEYNRHTQGARDLSVANIARIAEANNLFKQKTVWNIQSKDYFTLIRAWEAFNGPKSQLAGKRIAAPENKYAFLEKITDPAVRSLCQLAIGERDKLRAEINMLKSTTKWYVDMRPKSEGPIVHGVQSVLVLTDSELKAIAKAIDSKSIATRGWIATDTGAILDDRRRSIFEPGYITGIAKVLQHAKVDLNSGMRHLP
ncbi:gamma-mobile-trio protein GmtX [Polaromonas sp.]|uniref:gamma-mobile-trio protein GmtX n=1 Tax=Polaromonas sp. TaxID=1869339 RepID=UPI0025DCF3A0|nr:gamma-mobile-trio protein GmtX [Polaromonas sp.]